MHCTRRNILMVLIIMLLIPRMVIAGDLKLWYEHPASSWIEGLPLGNGSLMAVVQGGVHHERIQLNEESLWSGHLVERDNPEGAKYLDQIRQMFFEDRYYEAEQLVKEKMIGQSLEFGKNAYQSLGDLDLFFMYGDPTAVLQDYHRELDLETAAVKISYRNGKVRYSREIFSSAVDQALVIRLTADRPGALNFMVLMTRPDAEIQVANHRTIVMRGMATYSPDPVWKGVQYETRLSIETNSGKIYHKGAGIKVEGSDTVIIKLVAATDYRGDDPGPVCSSRLENLEGKNFTALYDEHIREYQSYFNRVDLQLGSSKIKNVNTNLFHGKAPVKTLTTDKRIEAMGQGVPDPDLIALYFQYGRYLLISASRPGTMAINLWGKWVNSSTPSYDADYHMNINIPMNYWPAEVCNLADCHTPFFDLIDALRPNGRITARKTYACDGFVSHHATDHSYFTAMIGGPAHGVWPMTPAWGCHQMWDHYLFTKDKDYLSDHSYPVMKEAAEFFIDYLIEDPNSGHLVSGPSCSPENRFYTSDGKTVSLSMGSTMDMQLIRDLFENCIAASKELDKDKHFRKKLEDMLPRLLPMQIGEDGRLMEWAEEFPEYDIGHKHISHMWGLVEDEQISPDSTPELAEAARRSLDIRVDNGTAITQVFRAMTTWVMQCYNRLWDGDEVYKYLKFIIGSSSYTNLMASSYQGMNRQMWETDANLGATAVIAEMFMQSHTGYIHLLPSLPDELDKGKINGLMARGAFEVDLSWDESKLQYARIRSLKGGKCKIKYNEQATEFMSDADQVYEFDGSLKQIIKLQ